jgi:hypothetical protein
MKSAAGDTAEQTGANVYRTSDSLNCLKKVREGEKGEDQDDKSGQRSRYIIDSTPGVEYLI